jgi:DNA repair protein RadC
MNTILKTDTVNGGGLGTTKNISKGGRDPMIEKKRRKKSMNSRNLKQHLKYIVPEMRLALIKEPGIKPQPISMPEDLDKFVEPLKHYAEEHFVSFHLDCKFNVIGYQIVSRGTISASLVHPREVFKAAILANSYAIIVAHNHPAGSLSPSAEDIETTKTLVAAGRVLGVSVLDHVIVSHNGLQSLRELKPELWFESY